MCRMKGPEKCGLLYSWNHLCDPYPPTEYTRVAHATFSPEALLESYQEWQPYQPSHLKHEGLEVERWWKGSGFREVGLAFRLLEPAASGPVRLYDGGVNQRCLQYSENHLPGSHEFTSHLRKEDRRWPRRPSCIISSETCHRFSS